MVTRADFDAFRSNEKILVKLSSTPLSFGWLYVYLLDITNPKTSRTVDKDNLNLTVESNNGCWILIPEVSQ